MYSVFHEASFIIIIIVRNRLAFPPLYTKYIYVRTS